MKSHEHDSQVAVIQWAQMHEGRYPALKLLFAVPNGGQRHKAVAVRLKEEGVKSGVPDLIFPIPEPSAMIYCGLAIEMKDGRNKTTGNQDWWLSELTHFGWLTKVCYSADEAINEIEKYLGISTVERMIA